MKKDRLHVFISGFVLAGLLLAMITLMIISYLKVAGDPSTGLPAYWSLIITFIIFIIPLTIATFFFIRSYRKYKLS